MDDDVRMTVSYYFRNPGKHASAVDSKTIININLTNYWVIPTPSKQKKEVQKRIGITIERKDLMFDTSTIKHTLRIDGSWAVCTKVHNRF